MDIVNPEKYYEQVLKRYPRLTEKQVDKIIKSGLRKLWYYNIRGDVLFKSPYYTAFIGKIYVNKTLAARYRIAKKSMKYRFQYIKNRVQYNGKYYFGLTEEEYQNEYLPQIRKYSNKRRKTVFLKEVHFYKILDECLLHCPSYVFEVSIKDPVYGFHKKLTSAYVKDFKLIATRNEKFMYTFISGKDKHETKRK